MIRRYTSKEVPNEELRTALNCWYLECACSDRLSQKCRESFPNVWKKCPKQTKKEYNDNGEEVKSD